MLELRGMACCGVREITGISNYSTGDQMVKHVGDRIYNLSMELTHGPTYKGKFQQHDNFRYAVFSAAGHGKVNKYGDILAAYISKHGLGDVVETKVNINPNTQNHLKVWIWTIDHNAMRKHLKMPLPSVVTSVITPAPGPVASPGPNVGPDIVAVPDAVPLRDYMDVSSVPIGAPQEVIYQNAQIFTFTTSNSP